MEINIFVHNQNMFEIESHNFFFKQVKVQSFDKVSHSSFPSREVCLRFCWSTFQKKEIMIFVLSHMKIEVCH